MRAFVAVLTVAALVAGTLTVVTVRQSREVERSARRELVGRLTAGSVDSLDTDPELSLLLALHAVVASRETGRIPAATVEALQWAIQETGGRFPREAPVVLVAGPDGTRGAFDLPLSQLLELARGQATRSLTSRECTQYFGTLDCPHLPASLSPGVPAQPIRVVEAADPRQPLAGTTVTLFQGSIEGSPAVGAFQRELEAFTAATGIAIEVVDAVADFEIGLQARVEQSDPPDIAFPPQPQEVQAFAQQGHLIDLSTYVDVEQLRRDQGPYLSSFGTVAPDGTWPSGEGTAYGAFAELNVKSLIWYPTSALRQAGYTVPTTWDELIALSDRMVSDGRTPWCVGFNSGPGTADGWPGTDWIENLMIAQAGPDVYDRWIAHEVPFDSPVVRDAFGMLGEVLFTPGYVYAGTDGARRINVWDAPIPMLRDVPPGCWLDQGATFIADYFEFEAPGSVGERFDVFPFPAIMDQFDRPMIGGGSMLVAFADRPEVREVIRFFLGPEYGAELATHHGWISANRRFDPENYTPFGRRLSGLAWHALETDSFRFDASDLMPREVGQDAFWKAMLTFLKEGPDSLDRILAELDASWPEE
jgi:alpha-glucoside transport system substrate-binding protein